MTLYDSLAMGVTAPASAGIGLKGLGELRQRVAATLRLWAGRASGRRQLETLDDRMLADIGIGRSDAWAETRKPFWRA